MFRKMVLQQALVGYAVLKPALLEHRHLEARHRAHALRDHLPLEAIERLVIPVREFDERNSL